MMKRLLHRSIVALILVALCAAPLFSAAPALAQSGNVWQVSYFNNPNWAGAPVFSQPAGIVSFNWGSDTPPGPNMPAQNWSARFNTTAFFYAGLYRFQIQADDAFVLIVDGVTYMSTVGRRTAGQSLHHRHPADPEQPRRADRFRPIHGRRLYLRQLVFRQRRQPAATADPAAACDGAKSIVPAPVQSGHRFRRLHILRPTANPPVQLLPVQRRLERAEHGLHPDGTPDPALGALHGGSDDQQATLCQSAGTERQVLQDRSRLVPSLRYIWQHS